MTDPDQEPDLLDLAPDAPGNRRFLSLGMLPSGGLKAKVASKVYEHERATYGIKGPQGHSLAIDLDLAAPVKDKDGNLQQAVTLVLNHKLAAAFKKHRPLSIGKELLLSPLGDVEDGA